jgi:hypothetical protein
MVARQRSRKPLQFDHSGIAYVEALCPPTCNRRVEVMAMSDTGRPVIHRTTQAQARRTYGHLAEQVAQINRSFAQMFPELTKVGFQREWFRASTGLGIDSPQNNLAAALATFPKHAEKQVAGLRCADDVWRGRCRCGRIFSVEEAKLARLVADTIAQRRGDFYLPTPAR